MNPKLQDEKPFSWIPLSDFSTLRLKNLSLPRGKRRGIFNNPKVSPDS